MRSLVDIMDRINRQVSERVTQTLAEEAGLAKRPSQQVLPYCPNYPYLAEYDTADGRP